MAVKKGNQRHAFKLSDEYTEKLKELANKENRSVSNIVEYIVTQYLDSKGRDNK